MERLMDSDVQVERGVERDMPRRTFIKGLAKGGVGFVFGLKALEATAGDVAEIKGGSPG